MFIELTDHLRCPEEHEEQYLVLLPTEVVQRSVRRGEIGCPACGRTWALADGILDLGGAPAPPAPGPSPGAEALAALLGLGGPGGYVAAVGVGAEAAALAGSLPGVAIVAVNPPAGTADGGAVSVVRSARIPLKRRSVRGVILGGTAGGDPWWLAEAARVVLPGRHVVGEGAAGAAVAAGLELLAEAGGWWVAVAAAARR